MKAELILNKLQPFVWSTLPYLGGFAVLMAAFFYGLLKRDARMRPGSAKRLAVSTPPSRPV